MSEIEMGAGWMATKVMSAEFAAALVKARSEMGPVAKTKKNPAFVGSRYADLADVLEEISDPLAEAGISLMMPLVNSPENNKVGVIVQLIYKTGEMFQTEPFFIPLGKTDAQGYIAASTYARRCFATSYFCLPTEDDDGNTASNVKPPQSTAASRSPQPPVQKEALKIVQGDEKAVESNVNTYLAKWDASYPEGKDGAGNILARPEKESLLSMTKAALLAGFNKLPVVLAAKAAK